MSTKRYYWFKMPDNFFNQIEIKMLRKIAGGDTFVIIYLKLLLISLKNNGQLFFEGFGNDVAEEVALEIDEDLENVIITLNFLQSKGLMREVEADVYELQKARLMVGSESSSAERKRRQRERERDNVTKLSHHSHVEIEKREDIELEKEKEKELKKKKKPASAELQTLISDYTSNPDLLVALNEYVIMRKKIKKVPTPYALKLRLAELDKLANNDKDKIMILDQSTTNCWTGIFPLKNNKGVTQNATTQSYDIGTDGIERDSLGFEVT